MYAMQYLFNTYSVKLKYLGTPIADRECTDTLLVHNQVSIENYNYIEKSRGF